MFPLSPIEQWIAPAVVTGFLGTILGAVINHWFGSRRDRLSHDRGVLEELIEQTEGFFGQLELATTVPMLRSTTPSVREFLESGRAAAIEPAAQAEVAEYLLAAWEHLNKAAPLVGRLSEYRYDGLREFGSRLYRAELAEDLKTTLRSVAAGRAVTAPERLAEAAPFPELLSDARLFHTLAIVYRRRGPLTPKDRLWWRTPKARVKDSQALVAVLRKAAHSRSEGERPASKDEVMALLSQYPELASLSEQQKNELAYKLLNDWIEGTRT